LYLARKDSPGEASSSKLILIEFEHLLLQPAAFLSRFASK
jgi:hypothetical protein